MIPLRDNIPSKSFPIVNWFIIIVNVGIFLFEVFFLNQQQAEAIIYKYGLIPDQVRLGGLTSLAEIRITVLRPFFTNMFLHGGWGHIISNMWILFIFGDNVEDRMGKISYFMFYILCGLIASFSHFILYRHSGVPAIGASGAISGVMAAYMFMFPKSNILSFIPIFIIPFFIPIPAIIYIGLWFIGQLISGASSLMLSSNATGIAFWAHIGGFLGGIVTYKLFDTRRRGG
ncbi:MAG: rhomboid family intramembrane serine protease [Bacteroidales bacterium]|nr:rhomboid family intramembrane serine protease [Bacteroidales bacterium]